MNFYYQIWVDCINRLRSVEAGRENWKFKSMVIITLSMVFNMLTVLVILQRVVLNYFFYEVTISSLSGEENYILTLLVLYFSPCILVNYLLIFRRSRYEQLLEIYPYTHNGKLALTYMLVSIFFPLTLVLIISLT